MYKANRNIKVLVLVCLAGLILSSCNNMRIRSAFKDKPIVEVTPDSIFITSTSDSSYSVSMSIQDENVVSQQGSRSTSMAILDLVRKCRNKNDLALYALEHQNTIPVNIKIDEEIYTIANYKIAPFFEDETSFSISGNCAPLVSKFSNPSNKVNIKRWLFRKKKHLNSDQIDILFGLANQLSHNKTVEYITNSTMPVVHNISVNRYSVKSNLEGDYYVLYACTSSSEIDKFVENIVSNDFRQCSKTPSSSMICYGNNNSGYKYICLIGIKEDWSYKVQPLGWVAVDNSAPSQSSSVGSSILFPNSIKAILPSNKPQIFGTGDVSVIHWDGNGLSCNCTFMVHFDGDASVATVSRTGSLAKWLSKDVKRIDLTKHTSPYTFTYELHLEDGDNRIPVTISDNHGNTRRYELNIRAEFVRSNSQDINIDNDIDIFN